jgi:hypothetical protein
MKSSRILGCMVAFLLVAGVLVTSGCNYGKTAAVPESLSNVRVVSAFSPDAKYAAGSKYAFVKLAEDSELEGEAALVQQRIEKAMVAELKKKGYKPSKLTDTKFFVVYTGAIAAQMDVLAAKGQNQGNEWIMAVVQPRDYVSGALLVEVIDAKTMEPVWLGVFNSDIALAKVTEEAKRERVAYAVRQVLASFPPK